MVYCVQVGSIDSEEMEVRILVHQSHAGRIIGKGGEKVKKFRSVSVYYIYITFLDNVVTL